MSTTVSKLPLQRWPAYVVRAPRAQLLNVVVQGGRAARPPAQKRPRSKKPPQKRNAKNPAGRRGNVAPGAAKAVARALRRRSPSCRVSPGSRFPSWRRRWASSRTTCTACCPAWNRKARSASRVAAGTRKRKHARAHQLQGAAFSSRPVCCLDQSLAVDRVALLGELGD